MNAGRAQMNAGCAQDAQYEYWMVFGRTEHGPQWVNHGPCSKINAGHVQIQCEHGGRGSYY